MSVVCKVRGNVNIVPALPMYYCLVLSLYIVMEQHIDYRRRHCKGIRFIGISCFYCKIMTIFVLRKK
jgi:hypothetical protein